MVPSGKALQPSVVNGLNVSARAKGQSDISNRTSRDSAGSLVLGINMAPFSRLKPVVNLSDGLLATMMFFPHLRIMSFGNVIAGIAVTVAA